MRHAFDPGLVPTVEVLPALSWSTTAVLREQTAAFAAPMLSAAVAFPRVKINERLNAEAVTAIQSGLKIQRPKHA